MAKFQGYARGKGFQSIDPGYEALSRMREKQKEDLSNLKEEQRQQRQRDLDAEANLLRVHKNEEANQKEIYVEGQVFDAKEKALRINRDQVTQNNAAALKKYDQRTANFEKLIEFSKTAITALETKRQKDWDATATDSYNFYMTHGMSLQDQIEVDLLEDKQWGDGEYFEQIADEMNTEGYTPKEVMWVRHRNSASDYGRLKAYSVIAGNKFGAWAASKLGEMGANTVEEKQAALEKLQIEYLKAHKLYGLSSDFLGPMFTKMQGAKDRIINGAELDRAVQESQKRTKDKLHVLSSHLQEGSYNVDLAAQSLNEVFIAKTREYDGKSFDTYTNAEARDETLKAFILDIDNFPDTEQVVEVLKNTPYADQNTKWYDANELQINNLLTERSNLITTRQNTNNKRRERAQEKAFAEVDRYFNPTAEDLAAGKGWNNDREVAKNVINSLLQAGYDPQVVNDRYSYYLNESAQTKNQVSWWEQEYKDRLKNNRLTSKDLRDPNFPRELLTIDLVQKVAKTEARMEESDWDDVHESDISDALTNRLVKGDIARGGKIDPSHGLAMYHAETLFRQCIIGGDNKTGVECRTEVLNEIKEKDGTFEVMSYGSDGNRELRNYFKNFTSPALIQATLHDQDFTPQNDEEKRAQLDKIDKDPLLIQTELLITTDQIKEVYEAVKKGEPYLYPSILDQVSSLNPEKIGDVPALFKQQVELAFQTDKSGLLEGINVKDLEPTFQYIFREVKDPQAKKLIRNIQTKGDLRKKIQIIGKPDSVRDVKYMNPNTVAAMTGTPTSITTQDMKNDDNLSYLIDPNPFQPGRYAPYGGGNG